jgi:hypothetical protein
MKNHEVLGDSLVPCALRERYQVRRHLVDLKMVLALAAKKLIRVINHQPSNAEVARFWSRYGLVVIPLVKVALQSHTLGLMFAIIGSSANDHPLRSPAIVADDTVAVHGNFMLRAADYQNDRNSQQRYAPSQVMAHWREHNTPC